MPNPIVNKKSIQTQNSITSDRRRSVKAQRPQAPPQNSQIKQRQSSTRQEDSLVNSSQRGNQNDNGSRNSNQNLKVNEFKLHKNQQPATTSKGNIKSKKSITSNQPQNSFPISCPQPDKKKSKQSIQTLKLLDQMGALSKDEEELLVMQPPSLNEIEQNIKNESLKQKRSLSNMQMMQVDPIKRDNSLFGGNQMTFPDQKLLRDHSDISLLNLNKNLSLFFKDPNAEGHLPLSRNNSKINGNLANDFTNQQMQLTKTRSQLSKFSTLFNQNPVASQEGASNKDDQSIKHFESVFNKRKVIPKKPVDKFEQNQSLFPPNNFFEPKLNNEISALNNQQKIFGKDKPNTAKQNKLQTLSPINTKGSKNNYQTVQNQLNHEVAVQQPGRRFTRSNINMKDMAKQFLKKPNQTQAVKKQAVLSKQRQTNSKSQQITPISTKTQSNSNNQISSKKNFKNPLQQIQNTCSNTPSFPLYMSQANPNLAHQQFPATFPPNFYESMPSSNSIGASVKNNIQSLNITNYAMNPYQVMQLQQQFQQSQMIQSPNNLPQNYPNQGGMLNFNNLSSQQNQIIQSNYQQDEQASPTKNTRFQKRNNPEQPLQAKQDIGVIDQNQSKSTNKQKQDKVEFQIPINKRETKAQAKKIQKVPKSQINKANVTNNDYEMTATFQGSVLGQSNNEFASQSKRRGRKREADNQYFDRTEEKIAELKAQLKTAKRDGMPVKERQRLRNQVSAQQSRIKKKKEVLLLNQLVIRKDQRIKDFIEILIPMLTNLNQFQDEITKNVNGQILMKQLAEKLSTQIEDDIKNHETGYSDDNISHLQNSDYDSEDGQDNRKPQKVQTNLHKGNSFGDKKKNPQALENVTRGLSFGEQAQDTLREVMLRKFITNEKEFAKYQGNYKE